MHSPAYVALHKYIIMLDIKLSKIYSLLDCCNAAFGGSIWRHK